ncbi:MAG: DNA ligase [Candidatus Thorarchaeota archaeon]|nr:MAG: DNA ligase [Candidatus Thorarchaeota archaeon]
MTQFLELAQVLDRISQTSSRTEKVNLIAEFLRNTSHDDMRSATLFLAGRVFAECDPRALNISWSGLVGSLRQLVDYSQKDFDKVYKGDTGDAVASLLGLMRVTRQEVLETEPLSIGRTASTFAAIASASGQGSRKKKETLMVRMLSEATPREAKYLVALLLSDTRTGVSEGLVAEGIAAAFMIGPVTVRRAWSLTGDLGEVAALASVGGKDELDRVSMVLFRPVKPMLATQATDLRELINSIGVPVALELKLDGARVQVHSDGQQVRLYSRSLTDVTDSLPDVAQAVRNEVSSKQAILDGEVIAIDPQGTPYLFQAVMTRFGRVQDVESKLKQTKLELRLFDVLMEGGKAFVDRPYAERRTVLEQIAPPDMIVERLVTSSDSDAERFFERSLQLGHEGLMVKKLDSTYVPGLRGKTWFKIKHTITLDMVIVGAEWGYGRRSKWLSDYHLAIRNEETDDYVMIGKTFKGLTDPEFESMTKRLLDIQTGKEGRVIKVRPEIVVEVLVSEIQESPTYDGGMTLRFARIARIRDDKRPEDATTLVELRRLYEARLQYKAT